MLNAEACGRNIEIHAGSLHQKQVCIKPQQKGIWGHFELCVLLVMRMASVIELFLCTVKVVLFQKKKERANDLSLSL